MLPLDIQMFAAGDLVNTTQNYVNSTSGDVTAFSNDSTLEHTMKVFYDTVLLDQVKVKDVFTQVSMKQRLPAQSGLTVEWRKWDDLEDAEQLTEGVIPVGRKMGQSVIQVPVVQYGLFVALSDRFMLHAIDDGVVGATERVGNSSVRKMQKVIRTALLQGTNTKFPRTFKRSDSTWVSSAVTSRDQLSNAVDTQNFLFGEDVALMQTYLITGNAETFDDGNFACIAHPHVLHDFMQSKQWQDNHRYTDSEKIYKGEVGVYAGIRFISSDLAPVIKGAPLTAAKSNLTVNATVTNATFTAKEAISEAEATALAGRKIIINGVIHTIVSAKDGAATAATITTSASATFTENQVVYPHGGGALGTAVYPTFFFGKDAFAAVEPEGANLRTIIKTPAQIGGPLEQFGTVGAKFETAATILYPTQLVTLEVSSSFASTAVAN